MMKILAVTGTRDLHRITPIQRARLRAELVAAQEAGFTHLRHGDAVGADALIHDMAVSLGYTIIIHPPDIERHRANCEAALVMPTAPYAVRNQAMVDGADLLLAMSGHHAEVLRSGTWQTIRMARKAGVPVIICYPNGTLGD